MEMSGARRPGIRRTPRTATGTATGGPGTLPATIRGATINGKIGRRRCGFLKNFGGVFAATSAVAMICRIDDVIGGFSGLYI